MRLLLLKLNRKHWNVPADQDAGGGGEPEDQLSVLQPAHVVHVLGVNVRLSVESTRAKFPSSVVAIIARLLARGRRHRSIDRSVVRP